MGARAYVRSQGAPNRGAWAGDLRLAQSAEPSPSDRMSEIPPIEGWPRRLGRGRVASSLASRHGRPVVHRTSESPAHSRHGRRLVRRWSPVLVASTAAALLGSLGLGAASSPAIGSAADGTSVLRKRILDLDGTCDQPLVRSVRLPHGALDPVSLNPEVGDTISDPTYGPQAVVAAVTVAGQASSQRMQYTFDGLQSACDDGFGEWYVERLPVAIQYRTREHIRMRIEKHKMRAQASRFFYERGGAVIGTPASSRGPRLACHSSGEKPCKGKFVVRTRVPIQVGDHRKRAVLGFARFRVGAGKTKPWAFFIDGRHGASRISFHTVERSLALERALHARGRTPVRVHATYKDERGKSRGASVRTVLLGPRRKPHGCPGGCLQ